MHNSVFNQSKSLRFLIKILLDNLKLNMTPILTSDWSIWPLQAFNWFLFIVWLRQGAQLGSDCRFTWNLCKISRYDVRGIFVEDKGEGCIQNVENYGIEVPAKTAGLYLVPKQRNLIFWDFGSFRGFLGGFGGIFGVSKLWGVFRTRGTNGFEVLVKTQGLYQLPKLKNLIFKNIFGHSGGLFVAYL